MATRFRWSLLALAPLLVTSLLSMAGCPASPNPSGPAPSGSNQSSSNPSSSNPSGGRASSGAPTGPNAPGSAPVAGVSGSSAASAGTAPAQPGGPKPVLRITATTPQVGDLCANLIRGIDRIKLRTLLGEGVDPHTYKLTRSDAAALHEGDLVLFSGLHLEGKMGEAIAELKASGKRVVELGGLLPKDKLLLPDGAAGQPDPHFWMDPELFRFACGALVVELTKFVGDDADAGARLVQNARAYNAELTTLHEQVEELMAGIPAGARTLITSHDAFGYFGRRYGLSVHGVQGISTESEAAIADIQRLVDLIVERKVPSVFVETSVSDKTVRAVIEQSGRRGQTVRVGGQLYSDAMGKPGSVEATYLGMLRHNAKTIAEGLGGKASVPASGAAAPSGDAKPKGTP